MHDIFTHCHFLQMCILIIVHNMRACYPISKVTPGFFPNSPLPKLFWLAICSIELRLICSLYVTVWYILPRRLTIVPLSANVYTKNIGCVCAHAFVLTYTYVSHQVMWPPCIRKIYLKVPYTSILTSVILLTLITTHRCPLTTREVVWVSTKRYVLAGAFVFVACVR